MIARITEHQIHHEAQRFVELDETAYLERLQTKVTTTEKMVAAIVYLSFRSSYWGDSVASENAVRVADEIGRKLFARNVTDFVVVPSRLHSCEYDKTYRLDFYAATIMKNWEVKKPNKTA